MTGLDKKFKVGDTIRMNEEASSEYSVTKEGSIGQVISYEGEGVYRVKFTKMTGEQLSNNEKTFEVSSEYMEKIKNGNSVSKNLFGHYLPEPYVFRIASKTPVFIINDRLYTTYDTQETLNSDFFQTNVSGKQVRRRIVESASLASLEELTYKHGIKKFEKIEKEYLNNVLKARKEDEVDKYKLINFIVNEVFPYFRKDVEDNTKITNLLGVETQIKDETKSETNPKENLKEDFFVSKLVEKIQKENFNPKRGKAKKLDTLLGYDPVHNSNDLPQNYGPRSLLGKVLEGRNAAIIDDVLYNLIPTKDKLRKILSIKGKNFELVSPRPVEEVKARYDFEISKQLRTDTLTTKLAKDKKLRELISKNKNLKDIARRKEYREGDFGFIKDNDDEDSYWVFLQVPKHVLKMPDDYEFESDNYDDYEDRPRKQKTNRYYFFNQVRVAIQVFLEDNGNVSYDTNPVTVEAYDHPFTEELDKFGRICLGGYNYSKLYKLKSGEAVARLLTDIRQTLLSGYTRGDTGAAQRLENFENKRITLLEIKKRNLPITNINLGRRRRR